MDELLEKILNAGLDKKEEEIYYTLISNGMTLYQGGTATNHEIVDLFNCGWDTVYSMKERGLLVVLDKESSLGPGGSVKVGGHLRENLTFNPLYDTPAPPELLVYEKGSPKERIEEIQNIIHLSDTNLDVLQEEYDRFVMDIKVFRNTLSSSGRPIIDRLNKKGFYIGSVEVESMNNAIELIKEIKKIVEPYDSLQLDAVMNLNLNDFSEHWYNGKPPKIRPEKKNETDDERKRREFLNKFSKPGQLVEKDVSQARAELIQIDEDKKTNVFLKDALDFEKKLLKP